MSTSTPVTATAGTAATEPVRQGLADPDVARRLMGLIRAALGRFLAGMTYAQRVSEAEEMFQEVSKRAIASSASFDPERGTLLHWLGGIVWNLARHRSPHQHVATAPTTLEETLLDAHKTVPDEVSCRVDAREILDRLDPDDAHLLRMHAEGLTAQEIATKLHLTPGNVRVRLSRLIKRVRGIFQNPNLEVDHD